jgi:hypothetical protein
MKRMKYIPGYKFKVGAGIVNKSASLLQQQSSKRSIKGDENFQIGQVYHIRHIKPLKEEGVQYIFDSANGTFIIEFPSINTAENKISKLTGV